MIDVDMINVYEFQTNYTLIAMEIYQCCMIGCIKYFDGLVLDCSNSSALAMGLLQSYTKSLI